jgi:glyoxylate/hydroxypyruvate reductase A
MSPDAGARIAVLLDLDAAQEARLRDGAGGAALAFLGAPTEDAPPDPRFLDCDAAFGNPPPCWIDAAPDLRWVQLESVGFGEYAGLDLDRQEGRIRLANLAGFFAEPVAESVLAGVLALYRALDRLIPLQANAEWVGDPIRPTMRLLAGRRVTLLGDGAINRRVAELLAPFGCAVARLARAASTADLDAALPQTDLLVAAVPDTPQTRGLFDRDRLARLPKQAVFVNVGRGSLVDEDALADALESGRLAGAVLDVTEAEPLPPGHRLWRAPNALLTQHTGGGTADEMDRKIEFFLDNLARYRAGAPLRSAVDFERGY